MRLKGRLILLLLCLSGELKYHVKVVGATVAVGENTTGRSTGRRDNYTWTGITTGQSTLRPQLNIETATSTSDRMYTEMDFITNEYQFDKRLSQDDDALKSYKDICGMKHSCNNSLSGWKSLKWTCIICPPCSCADNCHVFGTCCPDKAIDKARSFRENPELLREIEKTMSCRKMSAKPCKTVDGVEKNDPVRAMMVSRCPAGYKNNTNKLMCEGEDDISDVTKTFLVSSRTNNFTYRNIFCSRCHAVPDSDVEFWKPWISCTNATAISSARSQKELWERVITTSGCCEEYTPSPPRGVPAEYCWWSSRVIDRCNITGRWHRYNEYIEHMCSQPLYAVVRIKKGMTYKNIYCASCNGVLYSDSQGCKHHSATGTTFSYAALLDFSPRKVIITEETDPTNRTLLNCTGTQTWNPLMGECSEIQCKSRFQYAEKSKSCEPIFRSALGLGYKINVRLVLHEDSPPLVMIPYRLAHIMFQEVYLRMHSFYKFIIDPMIIVMEVDNSSGVPDGLPLNVTAMNISINLRIASYQTQTEVETKLDKHIFSPWILMHSSERWTFNASTLDDCNGEYFKNAHLIVHPALYFTRTRPLMCMGECVIGSSDYIDYKHQIACPHLSFNKSDISISKELNNVNITLGNYSLEDVNSSMYITCGDSVSICVSVLQTAKFIKRRKVVEQKTIANDEILIIISIIATATSLVCLLLTFITYCVFPELRTLPGLNTMALIAHLFAAQIVFQAGIKPTGNNAVCQVLGIVIHYLWMSSFAWMAVCAFHMFSVFKNVLLTNTGEIHKKRFISYIICGDLVPMAIPLICVLYHHFLFHDKNFGYGGWICFLNTPEDVGYFFAIPLGFVLCLNTIFFTITVLSIRKLPEVTTTNRKNRGHMCVYIKMSVLLGLTWVIGLIAAALSSIVLWYIFTIVNGSQGVFIFIAYVAKPRIFNSYRQLLSSTQMSKSTTQNSTNTSYMTAMSNEKRQKLDNSVGDINLKHIDWEKVQK